MKTREMRLSYRYSWSSSILVCTSLTNDAVNGITIRDSVTEALEYDGCHTFTTRIAIRILAPHATTTRG